jgi:TIR domain
MDARRLRDTWYEGAMAGDLSVFISYGPDTKSRAQQLTEALERQGIEAWVDFKDLQPGQRWKDELERAIGAARWVLILLGSGNRASAWQEAEWRTALAQSWEDSGKRLLPVLFGETEAPPFLWNWVALRVDPQEAPATWTGHVLDALRSGRSEVGQEAAGQIRRDRERRLDEIHEAAAELRRGHPDEPPVELDMRPR